MLAKCSSAALCGIDAVKIEVEVNVGGKSASFGSGGESIISIVGMPDVAVRESRDRIRSALQSCGIELPKGVSVVNLAPADLKKEGAAFDLPIAVALLGASGLLDPARIKNVMLVGELALSGEIRPVRGALAMGALSGASGIRGREAAADELFFPAVNAEEASLGSGGGAKVFGAVHLLDIIRHLRGEKFIPETKFDLQCAFLHHTTLSAPDFADVKGQSGAKRGLLVAAAGGHNVLMSGSPGTGKSMLASRLPGILPDLSREEALESSRIHSALGLLPEGMAILHERPFRSPHHTISDAGLIGGGRDPRPGEISLAHNGVLFMDEFPEFKRNVLEVLRQPLESGGITVSRASGSCFFPAKFMLVAAMNPCPCGRGEVELGCRCRPEEKRRYLKKISGPLLDRIDIMLELRRLTPDELLNAPAGESSAKLREKVVAAREMQHERFRDCPGIFSNSQMTGRELRRFAALPASGVALLREMLVKLKLSPRAYDRVLKVARTIADLAGAQNIAEEHLFEALSYRKGGFDV